jgi:hypothetical protein
MPASFQMEIDVVVPPIRTSEFEPLYAPKPEPEML